MHGSGEAKVGEKEGKGQRAEHPCPTYISEDGSDRVALIGGLSAGGWNFELFFVCYWFLSWGWGGSPRLWEHQVARRINNKRGDKHSPKGLGLAQGRHPFSGEESHPNT